MSCGEMSSQCHSWWLSSLPGVGTSNNDGEVCAFSFDLLNST
jgi:hypothetical protein